MEVVEVHAAMVPVLDRLEDQDGRVTDLVIDGIPLDGYLVSTACIYLCRAEVRRVTDGGVIAALTLAVKQLDQDLDALGAIRDLGLQIVGSLDGLLHNEFGLLDRLDWRSIVSESTLNAFWDLIQTHGKIDPRFHPDVRKLRTPFDAEVRPSGTAAPKPSLVHRVESSERGVKRRRDDDADVISALSSSHYDSELMKVWHNDFLTPPDQVMPEDDDSEYASGSIEQSVEGAGESDSSPYHTELSETGGGTVHSTSITPPTSFKLRPHVPLAPPSTTAARGTCSKGAKHVGSYQDILDLC